MSVEVSLSFKGQTEAALAHYQKALGAEVLFLMRFRDSPDQFHTRPGMEDLIFHATFRVFGTLMSASDVGYDDSGDPASFDGFSLAIQLDSLQDAKRSFGALAEQGQVVVPFAESKFTSWYGVVIDRFGVSWKLNIPSDSV